MYNYICIIIYIYIYIYTVYIYNIQSQVLYYAMSYDSILYDTPARREVSLSAQVAAHREGADRSGAMEASLSWSGGSWYSIVQYSVLQYIIVQHTMVWYSIVQKALCRHSSQLCSPPILRVRRFIPLPAEAEGLAFVRRYSTGEVMVLEDAPKTDRIVILYRVILHYITLYYSIVQQSMLML